MSTTADRAAAAAARRAAHEKASLQVTGERAARAARAAVPIGVARSVPFKSQLRSEKVEKDGKEFHRVSGYASVFGQDHRYEMWDWYGPYDEWVEHGAADDTLAANPDVVFLVNHKGLAMARTINGTLELAADDHGLHDVAYLNPQRQDVHDLVAAIDDGVITEQSFAFRIDEGWWNDDFTEFKISKFDIDRGDTSAVNYGANPYTDIASRQRDIMAELDRMPSYAARGVLARMHSRGDLMDVLGAAVLARREADRSGSVTYTVPGGSITLPPVAEPAPAARSATPDRDYYQALLDLDA